MTNANSVIMSDSVFEEICNILHVKDRASNKLVITLEIGEPVQVENHTYACKDSEDE